MTESLSPERAADRPEASAGRDPMIRELAQAPSDLLPNVFLVGAMKSGTSWLARQLQLHEDVFLPGVKEPNLLMKPAGSDARFGLKGPGPVDALFHQMHRFSAGTVAAYTAMYQGPEAAAVPLRLDASVRYLSSDLAADRLVRLHADHGLRPRILILLRDPTERTWSHWQMHRAMGVEPLGLNAALAAEEERLRDGWSDDWGYQLYSCYDLHLTRYFDRFDRADIHVEIFEEVMADRPAAMARVCGFLGIDPDRANTEAQDARVRGKVRTGSSGVEQVAGYYRPGWRRYLPKPVRRAIWTALTRVNRRAGQRALPQVTRQRLEQRFAPVVSRVEDMLGRGLPWAGGQSGGQSGGKGP